MTDFVEICLLQGLRYYEISRAVIIRSVGRRNSYVSELSWLSSAAYDFRNGRQRPLSWSTCAGLDRPRSPQLVLGARMRPLAGRAAHRSDCSARGVPRHHPGRIEALSAHPVRVFSPDVAEIGRFEGLELDSLESRPAHVEGLDRWSWAVTCSTACSMANEVTTARRHRREYRKRRRRARARG